MSSNNSIAHRIERLTSENAKDVAKLYKKVYSKSLSADFFRKKYNTGFTGHKFIGYIAYNAKMQPISFCGTVPCFISVSNAPVLAAQYTDSITHPKYQKNGLFKELATLTFELCKSVGISLVFGFPNQYALPLFKDKLKWQVAEPMDCFTIPVTAIPKAKISVKIPILNALYNNFTKRLLKKHAVPQRGVASSALTDGFDGVIRDDKYWTYKKLTANFVTQVNSGGFWIKLEDGLLIGDVIGINDDFTKNINELIKLAKKLGLRQIQFQASKGTRLHSLFSDQYQPVPSYQVVFKATGDEIDTKRIKFTLADIDIF